MQVKVRWRLLESFVRRGLLPADTAQAMAQWKHGGGLSVDGSVRIEAADRPGLERLLRYCARPLFALARLQQRDAEHLIYNASKPWPGSRGAQLLTPLQLINRLATLIAPPRVRRHRYYGVLAPNAPLRAAVATPRWDTSLQRPL